jgi:hypothetical protein
MRSARFVTYSFLLAAFMLLPAAQDIASAQGRRAVPRGAPRSAPRVVVGAYYRPLFLPPFYTPFFDPWWYPYPHAWYPPPAYYGRIHDDTASLRLQVSPRETEVFVDGYFAGTADDFDGVFQRLRLEPGGHEVTLYLAGHRTERQNVLLQDGGSFRIRHTMAPLAPGDVGEPRPTAPARRSERDAPGPDDARPRRDAAIRGDATFGAIALRVQPSDTEVLIDGEPWDGPRDDEALVVQVAPGMHRLEVRKEGYRSYTGEVSVTAAETSPLNVALPEE